MIKLRTKKGFTLVETLVAISILMVSIVGPMYSVFQAVQTTYIARDQLIATALAQEGIEYVRHHRDNNSLYNLKNPGSPVSWMNGLSACTGQNCMVDVIASDSVPPVTCSGTCSPLDNATVAPFYYNYISGTPSRFTRTVRINTVSANEVVVTSTVSWINSKIPFSVTVTEHLYNWL
ncbi:MAG: seg [Parcubacteria group bacterium]|nr:seg [Parcubacteria group bacterium]